MARLEELHGVSLLPIIGTNIRAYRKARGWKQADLADRCGMSRGQMNDLERRVQHASVWTLARVCRAFGGGMLVDDLITTNKSRRQEMVDHLEALRRSEAFVAERAAKAKAENLS